MIHSRSGLQFGSYYPVQTLSDRGAVIYNSQDSATLLSNALNKKDPYVRGQESSRFTSATVERYGKLGEGVRDMFQQDPDYRNCQQAFPVGGDYADNAQGRPEPEEAGIITGQSAVKLTVIEETLDGIRKSDVKDADPDFKMLKAVLEGIKTGIINFERARSQYPNSRKVFEVMTKMVPGKEQDRWANLLHDAWPIMRL